MQILKNEIMEKLQNMQYMEDMTVSRFDVSQLISKLKLLDQTICVLSISSFPMIN